MKMVLGVSKAGSKPKPEQERLRRLIDETLENGYVILPNIFSKDEIEEAKAEVARISKSASPGPASRGGRNRFEGIQTHRIYALLNKSRVFDKFAMHPDVLALNDYFLNDGYLINAYQSISIQPGEDSQLLHHDDSPITVPRPHAPFTTAIMVALDEYTKDNGSTVIIPKSHAWGDRVPHRSETEPVIMSEGSVVYFLGTLWHGGGKNETDKPRLALTVQYCMSWARPLENQILAVDWEKLDDIPPRIVEMMGYKVGVPFIGYADGRSPRTRVSQLAGRLRPEARSDKL